MEEEGIEVSPEAGMVYVCNQCERVAQRLVWQHDLLRGSLRVKRPCRHTVWVQRLCSGTPPDERIKPMSIRASKRHDPAAWLAATAAETAPPQAAAAAALAGSRLRW